MGCTGFNLTERINVRIHSNKYEKQIISTVVDKIGKSRTRNTTHFTDFPKKTGELRISRVFITGILDVENILMWSKVFLRMWMSCSVTEDYV